MSAIFGIPEDVLQNISDGKGEVRDWATIGKFIRLVRIVNILEGTIMVRKQDRLRYLLTKRSELCGLSIIDCFDAKRDFKKALQLMESDKDIM